MQSLKIVRHNLGRNTCHVASLVSCARYILFWNYLYGITTWWNTAKSSTTKFISILNQKRFRLNEIRPRHFELFFCDYSWTHIIAINSKFTRIISNLLFAEVVILTNQPSYEQKSCIDRIANLCDLFNLNQQKCESSGSTQAFSNVNKVNSCVLFCMDLVHPRWQTPNWIFWFRC